MSRASTTFADRIEAVTGVIGRAMAWLALAVVLLQFAAVALRYVFGVGSVWLTESVVYAHVLLVMFAAAWTLREEGHVRVDIFYAHASPRRRAIVDFAGALILLLPFALVLLWLALPYTARSWAVLERSQEAGGLPFVFLLKTTIPLFAFLLALQGVAQMLRAWPAITRKDGNAGR